MKPYWTSGFKVEGVGTTSQNADDETVKKLLLFYQREEVGS